MEMFDGLTLARVVKFNPHDGSLDCQLLYDGSRYTAVPVISGMRSSSSGLVDFHEPEGVEWDKPSPKTRDVLAVLGKLNDSPIVIGFLSDPVSQMLFDRKNFRVDRHASDLYSTINDVGDLEVAHPSGSFLRFGSNLEHEDLTGADFDGIWAITRNIGTHAGARIRIKSGGEVKATITLDTNGNVEVECIGNVTVDAKKDIILKSRKLTHNGVNVGDTHTHGDVAPGSARTSGPG